MSEAMKGMSCALGGWVMAGRTERREATDINDHLTNEICTLLSTRLWRRYRMYHCR